MPNPRDNGTGPKRFRPEDSSAPAPRQGRHRAGTGRHRAYGDNWWEKPAMYARGTIAQTVNAALEQRRRVAHLAMTGVAVIAATGVVNVPATLAAAPEQASYAVTQSTAEDLVAVVKASPAAPVEEDPTSKPTEHPTEVLVDKPWIPAPVAGLDKRQMANAVTIVRVGQDMGLSKRAWIVALMTAMQESRLYNVASYVVPESLDYSHQGTGSDHDSIGLFQQRASGDWGSVKQIMNPAYAAKAFYSRLKGISGWKSMALTYAAQAVQISAYPDAYAPHESLARAVVKAAT